MVFEILLVMALALVAGTVSGLLISWRWFQRLLAIEQYLKVREKAVDDLLAQIDKKATREMKSDAAKARWSKREMEEEALASSLARSDQKPNIIPWDPRTWGGT